MADQSRTKYGLYFDMEVEFFAAMETVDFNQHEQTDLRQYFEDAIKQAEIPCPEIRSVQLGHFIEPNHPERFRDRVFRSATISTSSY